MSAACIPKRAAGVLMPVSSLPSPYGIGAFGKAAYRWIDFLAAAGQSYWQVLPLSPTSYGDSPYQSPSAFAGNPYYVDLDLLCAQGLLQKEELSALPPESRPDRVDYLSLYRSREGVLRRAFARFQDRSALAAFREEQSAWIEDYALFMSIKAKMYMRSWVDWDEDLRLRRPAAMETQQKRLREDIDYHIFVQYLFFSQWAALRTYAGARGVMIIGDIPIYVAMDSADVWANSELFLLDEAKRPIDLAGVPPDGFSAKGQFWGNPLYRWDVMKADGYAWWLGRLRSCMALFDVLRIDHFRALESYFAIPYGSASAAAGRWLPGPGMDFLRAVQAGLGDRARIIAEDLGFLTPEVHRLLKDSGYPGMKILQFAFDSREGSDYMPYNYERHCVVYTGTHDNDTTRGWLSSAPQKDVALALEYLDCDRDGAVGAFIRAALSSVADLAVIPIQDYLGLSGDARINIPSTVGGNNWRWRVSAHTLSPQLSARMERLASLFGRKP